LSKRYADLSEGWQGVESKAIGSGATFRAPNAMCGTGPAAPPVVLGATLSRQQ